MFYIYKRYNISGSLCSNRQWKTLSNHYVYFPSRSLIPPRFEITRSFSRLKVVGNRAFREKSAVSANDRFPR